MVRRLKFQVVADQLRRDILAGTWPIGSKLPTEHELAESAGVSLTTVRHAFDELVQGAGWWSVAREPAASSPPVTSRGWCTGAPSAC